MEIAGFHNPDVRAARALQQRKHRLEQRCFLIEGPTAVQAALDAPAVQVARVFVYAGPGDATPEAAAAAARAGIKVMAVDERTMRALSGTQSPQGIVAVARFFHRESRDLAGLLPKGPCLVAVLYEIADPGNAGTLIRSAEAFGASAVCIGGGAVDPYNDKVVRASMGSMFHLPVVLYDGWPALEGALREGGVVVAAAEAGAPDVRSVTLPPRCALVVGQERRGLAGIPAGDIAMRIGIPQAARAESLNAAVAGSIAMYEIARGIGVLNALARTTAS